ncbi:MAG: hypothetical protein IK143_00455 [Bacteroidales bacterium]|nr:hypothetical protein [Bacteroidales bacterium]
MKRTVLLTALLSLLATACTVDKDYDLSDDNLDKTIILAKGYSIPVGSFEPVYIADILPATIFPGGVTTDVVVPIITASFVGRDIVIEGMDKLYEDNYHFTEATLKMVVKNTIPCNLSFSGSLTDTSGNIIPGSFMDVTGSIESGSPETPSYSPVSIKLTLPDNDANFDKILLHTTGNFGDKTSVTLNSTQYIQFTEVSLTLNSGILIKNK